MLKNNEPHMLPVMPNFGLCPTHTYLSSRHNNTILEVITSNASPRKKRAYNIVVPKRV